MFHCSIPCCDWSYVGGFDEQMTDVLCPAYLLQIDGVQGLPRPTNHRVFVASVPKQAVLGDIFDHADHGCGMVHVCAAAGLREMLRYSDSHGRMDSIHIPPVLWGLLRSIDHLRGVARLFAATGLRE